MSDKSKYVVRFVTTKGSIGKVLKCLLKKRYSNGKAYYNGAKGSAVGGYDGKQIPNTQIFPPSFYTMNEDSEESVEFWKARAIEKAENLMDQKIASLRRKIEQLQNMKIEIIDTTEKDKKAFERLE